jgi:hypothetical protein
VVEANGGVEPDRETGFEYPGWQGPYFSTRRAKPRWSPT